MSSLELNTQLHHKIQHIINKCNGIHCFKIAWLHWNNRVEGSNFHDNIGQYPKDCSINTHFSLHSRTICLIVCLSVVLCLTREYLLSCENVTFEGQLKASKYAHARRSLSWIEVWGIFIVLNRGCNKGPWFLCSRSALRQSQAPCLKR